MGIINNMLLRMKLILLLFKVVTGCSSLGNYESLIGGYESTHEVYSIVFDVN